jgi:predicted nucleotidyltransferase
MGSDPRPYPAWWHDRSARRREQLDRGVERLRTTIAGRKDIRAAIVFGSYARGEVGPESDLDVMIVQEPTPGLPSWQHGDALRAELDLGVPCDLIIYTPEQFERLGRERPFVAQACREGLWIDAAATG